jgi:hypothetical protein
MLLPLPQFNIIPPEEKKLSEETLIIRLYGKIKMSYRSSNSDEAFITNVIHFKSADKY